MHRPYPSVHHSPSGQTNFGVRKGINLSTMASNLGLDGKKDFACLDSGCNEFAVLNDVAHFPFEYPMDHTRVW